jgi:hypothetical protein
MAHTTPEGIGKAAAESGMAGIMQFGKERTEAMLAVQKELLEGYEEASRAWIARVKSEVELWSGLPPSCRAAPLSRKAWMPTASAFRIACKWPPRTAKGYLRTVRRSSVR